MLLVIRKGLDQLEVIFSNSLGELKIGTLDSFGSSWLIDDIGCE